MNSGTYKLGRVHRQCEGGSVNLCQPLGWLQQSYLSQMYPHQEPMSTAHISFWPHFPWFCGSMLSWCYGVGSLYCVHYYVFQFKVACSPSRY